jgi:hypothetical protein
VNLHRSTTLPLFLAFDAAWPPTTYFPPVLARPRIDRVLKDTLI